MSGLERPLEVGLEGRSIAVEDLLDRLVADITFTDRTATFILDLGLRGSKRSLVYRFGHVGEPGAQSES
jgi:hypothetical protein